MNNKVTTNLPLSPTEPKKNKDKLSKQLEQEQNQRNGDHIEGFQWGGGGEGEACRGNGTGTKKHNW